jgi:hypothetical protein
MFIMDYFGVPQVYLDMVRELDRSGNDYLTLLQPINNQWYLEGYVVNVDPSKRKKVEHALEPLADRFGLSIRKQDNSLVIFSITK